MGITVGDMTINRVTKSRENGKFTGISGESSPEYLNLSHPLDPPNVTWKRSAGSYEISAPNPDETLAFGFFNEPLVVIS